MMLAGQDRGHGAAVRSALKTRVSPAIALASAGDGPPYPIVRVPGHDQQLVTRRVKKAQHQEQCSALLEIPWSPGNFLAVPQISRCTPKPCSSEKGAVG